MTYPEAIQFLFGLRWFGARFGLENTLKLAALAGDPHLQLRFIHVAGTNGKGSTCAMLESIYRAAGLRVGLFTSPHLVSFGERIQVNRQPIFELEVARLVTEMRAWLEQGWPVAAGGAASSGSAPGAEPGGARSVPDDHPTFFEVVTVMALLYFAEQKCDLVIWETGLGGRLDATNIVTPLASVITNIQYDHQQWLGQSLASIAAEKAGVIKPGVPFITAADHPDALRVIEDTAARQKASLTLVPHSDTDRPPLGTFELPLLGRHQLLNAALAIATVRALAPRIPVSDDAMRAGLSNMHWAGRLQLITRASGQRVLLDGAHNVAGAEILATALREYFPAARHTLVLGILRDKDWIRMCEILAPLAARILLVPVPSERSATPQELSEACRRANAEAQILEFSSLSYALTESRQDGFITVAGSLYLIGEAMELLQLSPAHSQSERGLNEWQGKTQASSLKL
jgi:dihydrofolate synthase/folylpolyglutamate synthase